MFVPIFNDASPSMDGLWGDVPPILFGQLIFGACSWCLSLERWAVEYILPFVARTHEHKVWVAWLSPYHPPRQRGAPMSGATVCTLHLNEFRLRIVRIEVFPSAAVPCGGLAWIGGVVHERGKHGYGMVQVW